MMMQPGFAMQQPGMMMQPGMQQPGMMMQPGMEMMQPGVQQPGMMQPGMQQPLMQAPMMQPMTDGWEILKGMPDCEIQEKVRWGEVLTEFLIGVEVDFANKYKVLSGDKEVFLFAEETNFCQRQMKRGSCADCVGWHVEALTIADNARAPFIKMERPNTCTCCCFNRPVTTITDSATGNEIGSIRDPFACCDLTFTLMGPDGQDVLYAKGGCCQWGLCCQLPCGPCAQVSFPVFDAATGEEVAMVQKRVPSCCKFMT